MKQEQIKELIMDASKQALGEETIDALDSFKIADIGSSILDSSITTEKFTNALVERIGKIVVMAKKYVGSMPWLYVDSLLWGAYTERVYFNFAELIDDPSIAPVVGTDYSSIEHKFYGTNAMVKLFGKENGYMLPVSIHKRALRKAFLSESEMNAFITGLEMNIQNQLAVAYEVFRQAIVCDAIAVTVKNTKNVRHMLTEYNTLFDENLTSEQARQDEKFLSWLAQEIATDREYMKKMSKAFNDGTAPTFTADGDSRLLILSTIDKAIKFRVKADTYHKELVGLGGEGGDQYESVPAWQGSYDEDAETQYAYDTVSKIMLSADANNSLGIGTSAVTIENCIGFLFDKMALGFTNIFKDTTSSYTASADFVNYFHHRDAYGIIDKVCNMRAYLLD